MLNILATIMSNWDQFIEKPIVYILKTLLIITLSITRILDLRIGLLPRSLSIRPTRKLRIPASGSTKRTISVHVFEPPDINEYKRSLPVHVNFHGSAFVLPVHGSDAEICTYLATKLGCIVLDADYAKAPKHPFPAAIDDAMAVLSYVSSGPNIYDLDRVSIGGFSAGANVAILAAIRATKSSFPLHIKSIIAWYPPTNLTRAGTEAKSGSSLLNWLHHTLRSCYLPPGIDRGNPLVSPLFAKSSLFPPTTLIVSALVIG